jgi:flagellin
MAPVCHLAGTVPWLGWIVRRILKPKVASSSPNAPTTLRAQARSFGSNLSTVQIRQDFTKAMINTLQTGADNVTLADPNEEGANLLALQTRQQLSTTALSLASQASQAVLRLF